MKKMLMLMLAAGTLSASAFAVGPNTQPPRCEQVLAQIQETLKKGRPQGDPQRDPVPAVPASGTTAQ